MPSRREVLTDQLEELRTDFEALWVALTHDPKKEARRERAWTIFAGVTSAVAGLAARKAAIRVWTVLTGEVPPSPYRQQRPQKTA